jgi:hypothetical protein
MRMQFKACALASVLCSFALPSGAEWVRLDGFTTDTGVLAEGDHTGVFDGRSVLPLDFKINSAAFYFSFSDDVDPARSMGGMGYTGIQRGPYMFERLDTSHGDLESTYFRTGTNYAIWSMMGEMESVGVSLGGKLVGSGETTMAVTDAVRGTPVFQYRELDSKTGTPGYVYACGPNCEMYVPGRFDVYYTDQYLGVLERLSDWSGGFTVDGNIDPGQGNILGPLLNDRMLTFNLHVTGDLKLNFAALALDITPGPAVPEPEGWALGLGGLAVMWGLGRRRARGGSQQCARSALQRSAALMALNSASRS